MSYITFSSDKLIRDDRCIINHVIIRASSDAVINICDGLNNSGPIAIPLAVKAGDTVSVSGDIPFNSGVYVDVVSGAVVGSVIVS
jgi:hypothetical protein